MVFPRKEAVQETVVSGPTQAAFVSYSREDLKFALRLAQDLQAAGAPVWLDQAGIKVGRAWDDAVEAALTDAPQIIVILSPASAKSINVRDEISFALSKGKGVIPVLYKTCEVPLRLQRAQRIDFRTDYDAGLAALLQHLEGNSAGPLLAAKRMPRRRVLVAGGSAVAALAGGAWLGWPRLSLVLHPLPAKRFVALMAWPNGDLPSVASTVLDSIRTRLARAESKVKDLLIVASGDLPKDATAPANPTQVVSTLGANLVLAASLQSAGGVVTLSLQVLDAVTQQVYRHAQVSRKTAQLSELAEAGSAAAEQILGLPDGGAPLKDEDELKSVSPQVFQLYSDAQQQLALPNHAGLQNAILKYQDAVGINTRFALGFARLAMAFIQQYLLDRLTATLNVAGINAALAIKYNASSAQAQLSQGLYSLYSGKVDDAFASFGKSLQVDPGNADTLFYEAQGYRNANKWPQAEQVYREILNVRPNYWPAYCELGWLLNNQAKYKEAAKEYELAASDHPEVAAPLAGLGAVYQSLGRHDDAVAACHKSLKLCPNYPAYLALGNIAFQDGNYTAALANYQHAADEAPNYAVVWRDIADCYEVLGQPALVKVNYGKAAKIQADLMAANPRSGPGWAALAFYSAKTGDSAKAEQALQQAKDLGASDMTSRLRMVQAMALLGKKDDALKLLLVCLDNGLAPINVDMSLDLKDLKKDPRYVAHVNEMKSKTGPKTS